MKNFFLIFLTAVFLASCGDENSVVNKKYRKYSHLEKNNVIYSSKRKLPPSELMKLGATSGKKYKLDANQNDSEDYDISNEEEIANRYIADDGSYVGEYKVGKEYKVFGVTYSPQKYENFEEVGVASWYGDDFHGKKTANGEIYHKGDMTAAHPTLPLPSMVRITNLGNGKSVIVRVNDRGPFSKKRIIDVSERAATELGFRNLGTANVKLEYLKEETEEMLKKLGLDEQRDQ